VVVLRIRRPAVERPYRVWGYPWTPLVFAGTAAAFVVNTLIERPVESLIGLGVMASGLPACSRWRRANWEA
jgi:APA family basic amino acid/polyamine antiporter